MSVSAQPTDASTTEAKAQYESQVREILALDYSMPDYSIGSINAKVIGNRLATILQAVNENYTQPRYLNLLSVMQKNQMDGIFYCAVKKIKLKRIEKHGDTITIIYNTELEPNGKDIKKAQLVIKFVNGISDSSYANDLFSNICKYIRE